VTEPLLAVDDLRTYFTTEEGIVRAVDGISFTMEPGTVYGLIGPNGAGKTTTLRILATLLKPTRGIAKVYGVNVAEEPVRVRRMISFLPEEAGAYRNLTGREYLRFMAGFYAEPPEEAEEMTLEAMEISGLGSRLDDKVKTYSKGMKRRLQLARALAPRPRLAILDEPTSGLDVMASMEMRDLIRRYADEYGVSILLSSHNMLEVEHLSDRVGIIYRGRILAEDTPQGILSDTRSRNLEEAFRRIISSREVWP